MSKKEKRRNYAIIVILAVMAIVFLLAENTKQESSHKAISKQKQDSQIFDLSKEDTETQKKRDKNVRVLLKTTSFKSIYHEKVVLSSSGPYQISVDGNVKKIEKGKRYTFLGSDSSLKKKKVRITPSKDGTLCVVSLRRQGNAPVYRGTLEIQWNKRGLVLINELPLENYLYAVVSSEMATHNPLEALKAQAVCARSYVYSRLKNKAYPKYAAHLDDSVSYQVYNNVPEDAKSRKAVKETKGKILTYKDEVISAYYFSTSWGAVASGKEVWQTKREFPYLKNKLLFEQAKPASLDYEEAFEDFIKGIGSKGTYDSHSEWYRWRVTISQKSLSVRADAALQKCYAEDKNSVLTQTKTGAYRSKPVQSLGKIKRIRVEKREKSGLVTELVLIGKENVVKVCGQYYIRRVLAPVYEQVSYNQGKSKVNLTMLPSAAFYIADASTETKKAFAFIGGGFGHGTGMSQTAAAEMAKNGNNYQQILKYYFNGSKITEKRK